MRNLLFALLLFCYATAHAATLAMPTLESRQEALSAFAKGEQTQAEEALRHAETTAEAQEDLYTRSNELRYIAEAWAHIGKPDEARRVFAQAMDVACTIPTWNHRLYASIGTVELQRASGDLQGTRDNGMKALESGLLETIAATGEAAEMGRFFAALDGLLTEAERIRLRKRILRLGNGEFRNKTLHALERIKVKAIQ